MVLREDARPEATLPRIYEWNAQNYHALSDPQFDVAMQLMDELDFRGDEIVLDAGCGSGRLCEQLLQRVPQGRVIGIDASENMVHAARDFLAPMYDDRISIRRADLQVFCEPELANVIFSTSALHFVADHRLLFQNFAKVLRPGGAVALRFGSHALGEKPPLSSLRALEADADLAPYLAGQLPYFFGGDAIATRYFLQEAGFLNVQVETSDFTMDFSQSHGQPVKMLASDALRARLPTEALKARFDAKIDAIAQQPWCFDAELITVRATLPDWV